MGLDSKKDVVNMALLEFLERHVQPGEESYQHLIEFFEKNPALLKKMGFDSVGQLVEQVLKETASSRSPKQKVETNATEK